MGRTTLGAFITVGVALALALAFFLSPYASSQPDGLNKVAIDQGFDQQERPHALEGLPTAGYEVRRIGSDRLSTGLAGLIGVGVTFALGLGLFALVRAGRRTGSDVGSG
jgi:cobalt/nickel transport system permease protein